MLINSTPGSIHTAYNAAIFTFIPDSGGSSGPAGNRTKVAVAVPGPGGTARIIAELLVFFHNNKAVVDVSFILGGLFSNTIATLYDTSVAFTDEALSTQYLLLYNPNPLFDNNQPAGATNLPYLDGYDTLYTALRSAAQIQQQHSMQWAVKRFLTPFTRQYKYEDYPFDVSALPNTKTVVNGKTLIPNRINRIPVETGNNIILKFNN